MLEAAAAAELGEAEAEVRALRAAAARAPAPPPPVGEAVEVGGSSWPRKAAMFWRGGGEGASGAGVSVSV